MEKSKEVNKTKVIKSWRQIVMVLHELGYDFMYHEDIDNVADFIRKELMN